MKKALWSALALSIAALAPAACSEQTPEAPAAPDAPEGLTVANARLILPAVKGNPGAVYFEISNGAKKDWVIRAASVQGSDTAMIHQMGTWNKQANMDELAQVAVKAGETAKFEPGAIHVMTGKLADTVVAGGKTEVTLTFVGGDKMSFPAEVRAAGDERE